MMKYCRYQCCGSGFGLDPDSIGSLDPDPGGQKLSQKIEKSKKKIFFEVLDVLF
jgi:hypothetical protein